MRATKIGIVVMTICGLFRLPVANAQETDPGILQCWES